MSGVSEMETPSVVKRDGTCENLRFSPISGKSVKIVTKYCYCWERWLFNSVPFWDSVTFRYWVGVCFTEKSVKGFRGFFRETTVPTCGYDCCASGAQLLNSIAFCYRNPKMGLHPNPKDKMSLSFAQKWAKVYCSFLSNRGTAFHRTVTPFQGNVIWNHKTSTCSFLSKFNWCDFKSHLMYEIRPLAAIPHFDFKSIWKRSILSLIFEQKKAPAFSINAGELDSYN